MTASTQRGPRVGFPGETYGRLTIVSEPERHVFPSGQSGWRVNCRCECGNETVVWVGNLRRGDTTSCGCKRQPHGHASTAKGRSPTYISWMGMRARCRNPNHIDFKHYGERGVNVCDQWHDSFEAFLADMGERPHGRSLDRVDVNGNYEPGNCRWATAIEQRANRRDKQTA